MATSDDVTLGTLQQTLQTYTGVVNSLAPLELAATQKLANDQQAYANYISDPGLQQLVNNRSKLQAHNLWNVKDRNGNYYYVSGSGIIYNDSTSDRIYKVAAGQLQTYDSKVKTFQDAIAQDQAAVDTFDNPSTGTLTIAQNNVVNAQKAISDFVPTTAAGQANAVTLSNNATNTAASVSQTAQANAQAAQATAAQSAQAAKDAAATQANIATSTTETYIAIAVVLIVIIITLIIWFKNKKSNKTSTAAA